MERALEAVLNGDDGLNTISGEYCVPKTTLRRCLDGRIICNTESKWLRSYS
jgi:hypothetical protein